MLTIPLSTVAWIIQKAREFDAKDGGEVPEPGETDEDDPMSVLEDLPDDPTVQELTSWIDDLTDTQRAELVALFWLGRDDGDFEELLAEARDQQDKSTARYLLGSPMFGDYLEEGLARLGYDTAEIESELS